MIMFRDSFATRSIESRTRRIGVEPEFAISSEIPRAVSEFFERSPRMRPKSEFAKLSLKSGERLNEPESELAKNFRFSRGGNFDFNESGKKLFTSFRNGKVFETYSETFTSVVKEAE